MPTSAPAPDPATPRPGGDPLRALLRAACRAARHLDAGRATRVVVYGGDRKVIDLAVPDSVADGELRVPEAQAPPEDPPPGWSFTARTALYDGKRLAVAPSRVKLLRVLWEATEKLSAKELGRLAFDRETDEEGTRYHIRTLRAELAAEFPTFEGEIIPGDGGYRLALR